MVNYYIICGWCSSWLDQSLSTWVHQSGSYELLIRRHVVTNSALVGLCHNGLLEEVKKNCYLCQMLNKCHSRFSRFEYDNNNNYYGSEKSLIRPATSKHVFTHQPMAAARTQFISRQDVRFQPLCGQDAARACQPRDLRVEVSFTGRMIIDLSGVSGHRGMVRLIGQQVSASSSDDSLKR